MSDLALGNLADVKARVLAASLVAGTDYNTMLTQIGKAAAKAMEHLCNRKFSRTVGDTCTFSADRDHYWLPRTPVETITQVELKTTDTEGWQVQTDIIQLSELTKGLIHMGGPTWAWPAQIRVTYTGGYWYDTTEDYSGSLPSGATQVPDDLKEAWLLLCQHIWDSTPKLGTNILEKPGAQSALGDFDVPPYVRTLLNPFRRYQIT